MPGIYVATPGLNLSIEAKCSPSILEFATILNAKHFIMENLAPIFLVVLASSKIKPPLSIE
jgi:hypothetical protein